MGRNREKKTIRQRFLDWWLPVVALVLIIGAGRSFYLWSDRNYGQLTTSLITVLGVVVTLWMTQVRAIEQQEREDKRHHARLEAEAEMHDERLRVESEREHERLTAEAQKDRAQRSITQRIDLSEKLASAVEHLSSENELKQAAGVQEILFQIDDWHALIKSEIAGIEGKEPENIILIEESLRRRQEIFDIAYKFDTENVELLKSRARGLKQRLVGSDDHSLIGLDFSEANLQGAVLSGTHLESADFSEANLHEAYLSGAHLEGADFSEAHLRGADFSEAHLEGADFSGAHLQGVNLKNAGFDLSALRDKKLLNDAKYDNETAFPEGLNPKQYGMQRVDGTEHES